MKLHYSQTEIIVLVLFTSFSTLWNYTTLKRQLGVLDFSDGFSTLWNYTTLKPQQWDAVDKKSFSTLWNYTTLKPLSCLNDLKAVSVPYEITLLSNAVSPSSGTTEVSVPYEITLLSNN